jgi:hypothetical protein
MRRRLLITVPLAALLALALLGLVLRGEREAIA